MAKMWNSSCGVKKEPEVSEDRSKSKTVSAKKAKNIK